MKLAHSRDDVAGPLGDPATTRIRFRDTTPSRAGQWFDDETTIAVAVSRSRSRSAGPLQGFADALVLFVP
jgi:hypothetical protein